MYQCQGGSGVVGWVDGGICSVDLFFVYGGFYVYGYCYGIVVEGWFGYGEGC